jgi:hypothetical protein
MSHLAIRIAIIVFSAGFALGMFDIAHDWRNGAARFAYSVSGVLAVLSMITLAVLLVGVS